MGAGGHPVVPQMPAGGSAGEAVVGVLVRRGLGLGRGPDLVVRELGAPASAGVVDQDGAGRVPDLDALDQLVRERAVGMGSG